MEVALDAAGARRTRRRRPGTDAALASLALAAAVMLAGAAVELSWGEPAGASHALRAVLVVAWAVAGALLARRPAMRPLGVVVLAATLVAGAGLLAAAALAGGLEGGSRATALVRAAAVAALPAFGLHLLLGLPDGRLGTKPRRAAAVCAYLAAAVTTIAMWAAGPDLRVWPVFLTGGAALLGGGTASNRRYVRATAVERQRLQLLGCAAAVVGEAVVLVGALRLLVGWPSHGQMVLAAFSILLPASLAAGVSPRLAGRAGRLLVHTVSVTGLSVVVLGVYLLVVLGLGRLPAAGERSLLLLSMAAAGLAAVLYLPARSRLSGFANRLVYGEREAPDAVLHTFGSRLSRAVPMDELLLQLAESLRKTMGGPAEVWTGSDGVYDRSVSVPARGPRRISIGEEELPVLTRGGVRGNRWLAVWVRELLDERGDDQVRVAPVTNSGALLGLIVVSRPASADAFNEDDERVLRELARQVGLALHNVQLDSALQASLDEVRRQADELRASRARIVAASDAARRQIERNLHDGAQQRLVALSVHLRVAEDVVERDPEEARAMLARLRHELQVAVQELRDLAHGIYPPLLMDRGLAEALRAAAARSPLPADVEARGVGRYSQDVEAAAYFCCLEALQNAGKHAGPGAAITISLCDEDGYLSFEVADDGAGFNLGQHGRGAGFVNMADRVGAMGGELRVDSALGRGTKVRGRIPLTGARSVRARS